jgi:protoporphyrinogen oxidase
VRRPRAPVVIIGAGPAGLTAALALAEASVPVLVLEGGEGLGGIARTVRRDGYRFDVGGHRFFTRSEPVSTLWDRLMGADLLERPRSSRILYRGRRFEYPLRAANALAGLGPGEAAAAVASYLGARLRPLRPERTLEDWLVNRFGRRLYEAFFESYSEKVWGVPCREVAARWAAQRIRGLSLRTALLDMLFGGGEREARSLATRFRYPRLGPGMMWERMAARIEALGGAVRLRSLATRVELQGGHAVAVHVGPASGSERIACDHVLSTMPLGDLAAALDPSPPAEISAAAGSLRHRAFITVGLLADAPTRIPDTWLYVHERALRVGRVQIYNNWSPDLVEGRGHTCFGLEYFCSEGDALWKQDDAALASLAERELAALGLGAGRVLDATVVRVPRAYPMYGDGHETAVAAVRAHLDGIAGLQTFGRNAMHRYNNMDHAMLAGLLAARNVLGERHDLWEVNADERWVEDGR